MATVFLDTNWVIDVAGRRAEAREEINDQQVYLSPLSIHILCYANKVKLPDKDINKFKNEFSIVGLTNRILDSSLEGPTTDLEDNIQLHSAAKVNCDYFLTNDKQLLKMGYFGKTRILNSLAKNVL